MVEGTRAIKGVCTLTTAIVIDDDYDTTELLSDLLQLKKIQVLDKGYNGKDAVDLYRKLNPDVVFLDVIMPHYDGFYGLEKIKQLNPDAVIIMVTADLSRDTEDKLQKLKASAIIFKPYDINHLTETTLQVLKKQVDRTLKIENRW